MALRLHQSIVDDRVQSISTKYGCSTHEAFLRLVFYLVTGQGYDDLEPEDIIDGTADYQIDAIYIDDSSAETSATVTVIQTTCSQSLSSDKLIKMHAGLDYLVQQPKNSYSALTNTALRDKIQEFRDLRNSILASNIRLQCYYACLGDPSKASKEFKEQVRRITRDYNAAGPFVMEVLGPKELSSLLDRRERRRTKVNERIRIRYDQNTANLIEHSIEGASGIICITPATEIARIVRKHPTIFDENLRRFLGIQGDVNQGIMESCTSPTDAPLFWFLNNGITMVCDNMDVNKDYDKPYVRVGNLQIVNGCQTSVTLAKALEEGTLQRSAKVMLRVFQTGSLALASKLVVTTNTQNKMTVRDLRANDKIQKDIQAAFVETFNLSYERKPNEFATDPKVDPKRIVSNQRIGQAYLAIVRKRPSDARRRQYKVWQEEYANIFNDAVFPETYLLAHRIAEQCAQLKRSQFRDFTDTDPRRAVLANGVYHITRAVAFTWRGGDNWDSRQTTKQQLSELEENPQQLEPHFAKALTLIAHLISATPQFAADPSTALKSGRLDDEIDKHLYSKLPIRQRPRRR